MYKITSLYQSLTVDARPSQPETHVRDDLDNFFGLPTLPFKTTQYSSYKNPNNTDTKPEIIGDTLVYLKAKLIATLITNEHFTGRNNPYHLIQDYINFSQSPNFGVKILNIWKLTRFCETQDWSYQNVATNSFRMMLWRGSYNDRVRSDLENGFLNSPSPGFRKSCPGFYFADRIAESSYYCSSRANKCEPNAGEIGYMFLCEVQIGRIYGTRGSGQHQEHGKENVATKEKLMAFDSVKLVGHLKPDVEGEREVNGIIWPLGVTIGEDDDGKNKYSGMAKGALNFWKDNYNEYIVYDQSKIKIKYLVMVEFTTKPIFNM